MDVPRLYEGKFPQMSGVSKLQCPGKISMSQCAGKFLKPQCAGKVEIEMYSHNGHLKLKCLGT